MKRDVLLLNQSEEVLQIISWKRAVRLLQSGRATKPYKYNKSYQIRTVKGVYDLPAAIVLLDYVLLPSDNFKPTRRNVFKRDKWTCQYCGFHSKDPANLTVDHVHPRCKGGDSSWTNLVTACPTCNQKKSNHSLRECGMTLDQKPKKPNFYAMRLVGLDDTGKEMWSRWIKGIHIE